MLAYWGLGLGIGIGDWDWGWGWGNCLLRCLLMLVALLGCVLRRASVSKAVE